MQIECPLSGDGAGRLGRCWTYCTLRGTCHGTSDRSDGVWSVWYTAADCRLSWPQFQRVPADGSPTELCSRCSPSSLHAVPWRNLSEGITAVCVLLCWCPFAFRRGDHMSGKPGNVVEFGSSQENVSTKYQEESYRGKLFIANWVFGATPVFNTACMHVNCPVKYEAGNRVYLTSTSCVSRNVISKLACMAKDCVMKTGCVSAVHYSNTDKYLITKKSPSNIF